MLSRNWRQLCRRYSQATTFRTTESSPVSYYIYVLRSGCLVAALLPPLAV